MNYTKPMIELVYELRRRVPSELKPGVKLANPDLFDELIAHYHSSESTTITKALIKELLNMASGDWPDALENADASTGDHSTKVYRGLVSLEEKPVSKEEAQDKLKKRKKRVYRGSVIE